MSEERKAREQELIEKAQQGDRAAFGELVRTYHQKVYMLIFHMLHNTADAEDLTQDAFMRAYRGLKSFNFKCEFYTWLYRIAVNVTLNHIRKMKRRSTVSLSQEALPRRLRKDTEAKDPRELAEARQLYERVLKGIDELSPALRATLVLFSFQGLTHKAVAEVLGCAEGTVAWRISEARQQLRRHLKRQKRGESQGKRNGLQGRETENIGSP
jgi:RNA polymerase sigma-70 factor (ECF subfamily)